MWLFVGLGNPGSKYLLTRHNIGFIALDFLVKSVGVRNEDGKKEFNASTIDFKWDAEPVKLAKPQTFMNLSGESVGELARYYKVDVAQNLIVIHDEVDLPFGRMRIAKARGPAGHNGVKSIIEHLGTNDFLRVRVGVGRGSQGSADHVLQNFSKEEQAELPGVLERVIDAVETIVFEGAPTAMNRFNTRDSDESDADGV